MRSSSRVDPRDLAVERDGERVRGVLQFALKLRLLRGRQRVQQRRGERESRQHDGHRQVRTGARRASAIGGSASSGGTARRKQGGEGEGTGVIDGRQTRGWEAGEKSGHAASPNGDPLQ